MLLETSTIVGDSLKFADIEIDPNTGDVMSFPEAWRTLLTPNELEKRLRLAKMAWMSSGEVPYGLKVAKEIATGIMKSRSAEQVNKPVLRIQNAVITTPTLMREIDEPEVIEVDE